MPIDSQSAATPRNTPRQPHPKNPGNTTTSSTAAKASALDGPMRERKNA
jgi:hypothetical protein